MPDAMRNLRSPYQPYPGDLRKRSLKPSSCGDFDDVQVLQVPSRPATLLPDSQTSLPPPQLREFEGPFCPFSLLPSQRTKAGLSMPFLPPSLSLTRAPQGRFLLFISELRPKLRAASASPPLRPKPRRKSLEKQQEAAPCDQELLYVATRVPLPAEEGATKSPGGQGSSLFFREAFGEEGEAPEPLRPARPVVYLLSHPSCWASASL